MTGSNEDYTGFEIAITGMSGRFPGAVNIDEFWENLEKGVESITFSTEDKVPAPGLPPGVESQSDYVDAFGRVPEKEFFDSSFFGYLPDEARVMDPQIRMLHECVWEALEDSGYNPETYPGLIGLYAGSGNGFNWELNVFLTEQQTELDIDPFFSSLIRRNDFLTASISYKLNLRGPSLTVFNACTTSLTAVHEACQALLSGECDMAAAGGVSVDFRLNKGYIYRAGGPLSPDGHSRPFDAMGKGTVGAEGAGVVILKPLDSALQDRDHIYAVIRASFLNNDGHRKVGFTAPSVEGQAEAIRHALASANVPPESIGYIEPHGTGSLLGDPVEFEALRRVFGSGPGKFCVLGALKSNTGHMDTAAGIASLIKAALVIKHRKIPGSIHFQSPNPALDFDKSPFIIHKETKEWTNDKYPLRAGVNGFSVGGTNVHVILEEAPEPEPSIPGREYQLFCISARTGHALERMTVNLTDYFKRIPDSAPGTGLADIAYTLQVGRKTFSHRRAWVCRSASEAADILSTPQANRYKTMASGKGKEKHTVIFMFPGQGAQYVDMGKQLYLHEPLFRDTLDSCFAMAKELTGKDLKEILFPARSGPDAATRINQTENAQPLLFFIEYALALVLQSWGIEPDVMIGHSIGEYAAACLGGVFSLEEAIQLVLLRGRLMQEMPHGSMLSVSLTGENAVEAIKSFPNVSLAAQNAPDLSVLSGPAPDIDALEKELTANGVECRRLHTSHAFHSVLMDPILERFREVLKVVHYNPPIKPYVSNITGKIADEATVSVPGYWSRHLREAVDFTDGVQVLLDMPNPLFIEVGPGKTLGSYIRRHPHGNNPGETGIMNLMRQPNEEMPDHRFLLERAGELWLYGVNLDWERIHEGQHRHRVSLPVYPFERIKYPVEANPVDTLFTMSPGHPEERKGDLSDWFHCPSWKRAPLSPGDPYRGNRDWVVFIDEHDTGKPLADKIRAASGRVIIVRPGSGFEEKEHEKEQEKEPGLEYVINPRDEEHYNRLFDTLAKKQILPGRIVYMWELAVEDGHYDIVNVNVDDNVNVNVNDNVNDNVDDNVDDNVYDTGSGDLLLNGYSNLLSIARSIGKTMTRQPVHLFVLTNRMQDVLGEDATVPLKSVVLGPVRVIPREFENISCRSIDVLFPAGTGNTSPAENTGDRMINNRIWEDVLTECSFHSSHPEVAYRGTLRWVKSREPVNIPLPRQQVYPRKDGVYLVTGGLEGTGYILAQYLAVTYGCVLILTGPVEIGHNGVFHESKDKKENIDVPTQRLAQLKTTGAPVRYITVDIADALDFKTKLAAVEKETGTLTGIIHTAGHHDSNHTITGRGPMDHRQILALDIRAALVLDRIAYRREVEFFFTASSLDSALGARGQVAECAANGFLHAFASFKQRQEGNITRFASVGWDVWQESAVEAKGMKHRVSPNESIEIFKRALGFSFPVLDISALDIQSPVPSDTPAPETEPGEDEREFGPVLMERPELTTPYQPPVTDTEKALAEVWQNFFGIGRLGIDDDFFELGGDSLKATVLISKIHRQWNIKLPLADFYQFPTIKELAPRLGQSQKEMYVGIEPAPEKPHYALSFNQARMWLLHRMDPTNPAYHIYGSVPLETAVNEDMLRKIFDHIVKRHESFRTRFFLLDEEPVQEILPSVDVPLRWVDISSLAHDRREPEMTRVIKETALTPFDLDTAPLFRITAVKTGEQNVNVIFVMHHIISDGWSIEILKNEFQAFFLYETGGDDSLVPEPLDIQYKDFAEWQNRNLTETGLVEKQRDYWTQRTGADGGGLPVLNVPRDFHEPGEDKAGTGIRFMITGETFDRLTALAREKNCSVFSFMLADLCLAMNRVCKQDDIVIGILGAGRGNHSLNNIVGFFVNTLLFKSRVEPGDIFSDYLQNLHKDLMEMLDYQGYPLELVYRDLGVPFPDIPLMFDVIHKDQLEYPVHNTVSFELETLDHVPDTKFGLSVKVIQYKNCLDVHWMYRNSWFNHNTVEFIAGTYAKIITRTLQDAEKNLKDYVAEKKKKRLKLS